MRASWQKIELVRRARRFMGSMYPADQRDHRLTASIRVIPFIDLQNTVGKGIMAYGNAARRFGSVVTQKPNRKQKRAKTKGTQR